ncbi:FmdB family zinc ribbon protein [Desulfofundulus thermocisternus]|uniref:FmdB family zinc ribbon protein n=1 Tax=Desulfofundulus thermocisternus TaxID=42471 RepID=UPI0019F80AA3|nr:zinc ribbon domain-containing protein [Desulfofundulus thermocisternus]MBE3586770.1 zinc ribbon domain-containing protein [Thermoanaerobacter sp.]MCS5697009.1 zinc ribbon domain-containing protein [Desulfofundulus thermocisternus]
MPIYEFRCLSCGNLFEKLFLIPNEEVEIRCPKCKSDSFERVISRVNYVNRPGSSAGTPKVVTKSCSPGSTCATFEIPGPGE